MPTRPKTTTPPAATDPQTRVDLTADAAAAPAESPALPHERDQQPGATGGVTSKRVRQAARDVARGVEDTSRAPEADRAYRKLKR
ncbi:MAG TPA: hypothetical protein VNU71_02755 [Burkholderiaceae bacterium]|nr:hypothetical protein [Burkholderiaceae bacterium]